MGSAISPTTKRPPANGCSRTGGAAGTGGAHGRLGLDAAPLFAAAFATHKSGETFLVGLAPVLGRDQHGLCRSALGRRSLTGAAAVDSRAVCGVMTAVGGLGHTFPYLIPYIGTGDYRSPAASS